MMYNEACGERLSRLGFGCMRLPQTPEKGIDEAELQRMVDYAIAHGVFTKPRLGGSVSIHRLDGRLIQGHSTSTSRPVSALLYRAFSMRCTCRPSSTGTRLSFSPRMTRAKSSNCSL